MIGVILEKNVGTANGTMVYLTNQDLASLRRLQPILPDVSIMLDQGVFSFKRGRAVIHRDEDGRLRKIDVDTTRWSS